MVQGYDSCFGCRRSRVQIPVWPFLFTFKIIANIMTPQWMMKNVLILCQRKKLYTQGTLGVEPRTCRTAAGCSTTELYPLLQATRPKTNQTPYNSPTIVFRMLTLANSKGKKYLSEVGFVPTPSYEDQNSLAYSLSGNKDLSLSLAPQTTRPS